jgi:hypothetical protein
MFTSRYNEPQDQDLLKTTTGLAISTAKRLILRVLYRIREACTCEYIYIHTYIYMYIVTDMYLEHHFFSKISKPPLRTSKLPYLEHQKCF